MHLNDFEKHIDAKILARGKEYYYSNCVLSVAEVAKLSFEAEVEGTDTYLVEVELDSDHRIIDACCDCPYDLGVYCKHQVAVFYALRDIQKNSHTKPASGLAEMNKPVPPSFETEHQDIMQILSARSKEELVSFLSLLAIEHDEIKKRIELNFINYGEKDEVEQCRYLIRSYIDRYTNRRGYIEDENVGAALQGAEIVLEKAQNAYLSHNPLHAAELIFCTVGEMLGLLTFMDDADGGIEAIIEDGISILNDMIADEELTVEEQECLFHRLLEEAADSRYDEWDDWRLDLLDLCIDLAATEALRKQLDQYFCALLEKCCALDNWNQRYLSERVSFLRYTMIIEYENQQAAQAFLQDSLRYPKFREIAINQAMTGQNYDLAVQYAREGEEQDKDFSGLVSKWRELRYKAYKAGGDVSEQRKLGLEFILTGSFEYYTDVKNTYPAADWAIVYPKIIFLLENQHKTYMGIYSKILIEEGEKSKLLSHVKERPDLIERFYENLMPEYTVEVWNIFNSYIQQKAFRANKRKDYEAVCSIIKLLKKAGGDEAARQIVQQLRLHYYRRPAFLDELSKIC